MQSQVDEISPVLVAVKVEVPWDQVAKDLEQAYRKVQKTARIRGFRPGKVPRNVVKNLMGPSVKNEVANTLVQQGLASAMDTHKIDVVQVSKVDAESMTDGSPFKFTAQVEVRPKIEDIKLDSLTVERKRVKVKDEAVDAEIEKLRDQNSELVTPDPTRPAKEGDLLTISVQMVLEGQAREDLSIPETKAELGSGRLLPEIEQGLLGMEMGQEKPVSVTFPENYNHPELAGKTAELVVNVKELQEKRLPAVDDEFAKDLEHDSLEAMRTSIKERLEKEADDRADANLRDAVVKKLIEDNPVPVPPSLIAQQAQGMIQEMLQFQRYLGQSGELSPEVYQEMQTEAEHKVRGGLLFGEIARAQEMTVTKEEVDKELETVAERTGQHIAKVRAEHQGPRMQHLESRLLENKLLEYLLTKATITESEVDEQESTEASQ